MAHRNARLLAAVVLLHVWMVRGSDQGAMSPIMHLRHWASFVRNVDGHAEVWNSSPLRPPQVAAILSDVKNRMLQPTPDNNTSEEDVEEKMNEEDSVKEVPDRKNEKKKKERAEKREKRQKKKKEKKGKKNKEKRGKRDKKKEESNDSMIVMEKPSEHESPTRGSNTSKYDDNNIETLPMTPIEKEISSPPPSTHGSRPKLQGDTLSSKEPSSNEYGGGGRDFRHHLVQHIRNILVLPLLISMLSLLGCCCSMVKGMIFRRNQYYARRSASPHPGVVGGDDDVIDVVTEDPKNDREKYIIDHLTIKKVLPNGGHALLDNSPPTTFFRRTLSLRDFQRSKNREDDTQSCTSTESSQSEEACCSICLRDYEAGEETGWSQNPECVHGFHKECIVMWLMEHDACPCCRQSFIPE